jgi:hypothetical protein
MMTKKKSFDQSQGEQTGSSQPASTAASPPFAEPLLQVLRDLIDETEFILLSDGPDGTKLWKLKISLEQMRLKLDRLAASAPPVQETWHPIVSAPRDGRPFLVSWSKSLMGDPAVDMVGSWAEYEEILGYGEPPATHWYPIPAPPERPTHG